MAVDPQQNKPQPWMLTVGQLRTAIANWQSEALIIFKMPDEIFGSVGYRLMLEEDEDQPTWSDGTMGRPVLVFVPDMRPWNWEPDSNDS